jgi:DNA-binding GntR family transcriptional regulator
MSLDNAASRTSEVVRRLEQEILYGRRNPGDKLDERQLAESFGVSRTPVREALQRLAASGLVVARGRQGLRVAQLSVADLLDAFSVVAELEALAAMHAARRIQPEECGRLEDAHRRCDAEAARDDAHGFYDANLTFHEAIAAASHNRLLQEELRRVTLITSPYRRVITYQPGRMRDSIPEHAAIMEAILKREAAAAASAMREHVRVLGEGLSDLLHFLRLQRSRLLAD